VRTLLLSPSVREDGAKSRAFTVIKTYPKHEGPKELI
jgi:hypothetical protein